MTMPDQRTRSVIAARDLLERIATAYAPKSIKRVPSEVRMEARAILRHFPHWFDFAYEHYSTGFCRDTAILHGRSLDMYVALPFSAKSGGAAQQTAAGPRKPLKRQKKK